MNANLAFKINKIGFKCTFSRMAHAKMALRSACEDLPKLPSCCPSYSTVNLPQSWFPPLCCLSFDLQPLDAYTRTHAHKQSYACMIAWALTQSHAHKLKKNTAIPTAAHVCTKNTSHSHIHVHLYTAKTLEVYLWAVLSHAPLFRSMLEAKSSESCRCISTLAAVLVEGKHAAANRSDMWVWVYVWLQVKGVKAATNQCCGVFGDEEVAADTAVAWRSPKVKLWYCLSSQPVRMLQSLL